MNVDNIKNFIEFGAKRDSKNNIIRVDMPFIYSINNNLKFNKCTSLIIYDYNNNYDILYTSDNKKKYKITYEDISSTYNIIFQLNIFDDNANLLYIHKEKYLNTFYINANDISNDDDYKIDLYTFIDH